MEKETGGPAFPTNDVCYNGMNLRDYFAAKAMQATLPDCAFTSQYPLFAKEAYAMADAMLEARK